MAEELLGPYRLESVIGQGGMGQVWRARDTRMGERVVALKVLSPALAADAEFRARFTREADRAAGLRSPHIIPVHSYGEADGRLYIEMPLARGTDLDDLLRRVGPLPAARAVRILSQVARALDAAHEQGLAHRDVKPANVLVVEDDDDFVYLVDFGIAKPTGGGTNLTGTQHAVGSMGYMAPERFESAETDHRVDVYALGCLLVEMLTGRPPFEITGLAQAVHAHLSVPPPAPSRERPDVDPRFDEVVRVAMAKDPTQRYRTAGALAEAAQHAAGTPPFAGPVASSVPPGTPPYPGGGRGQSSIPTGAGPAVSPFSAPHDGLPPGRPGLPHGGPPHDHPPPRYLSPDGAAPGPTPPRRGRRRWVIAAAVVLVLVLAAGAAVWRISDDGAIDPPTPVALAPLAAGQTVRLPTGSGVEGLATSPDGHFLYAGVRYARVVAVVDATTNTRLPDIPLPGEVTDVEVNPDGRTVYAAAAGRVHVISAATNAVTGSVPLAGTPYRLAVSPDGKAVYASLAYGGAVAEIDAGTLGILGQFHVGDRPQAIAVSPDSATLYVANGVANTVSVLDARSGAQGPTIPVGTNPRFVAFAPDGSTAWVANQDSGTITVIDTDTASVVSTLADVSGASEVSFDPRGSLAFAATSAGAQSYDAETRQRQLLLPTGRGGFVEVAPDGSRLYQASSNVNELVITGLASP